GIPPEFPTRFFLPFLMPRLDEIIETRQGSSQPVMLYWHLLCSSVAFAVASRRTGSRASAFVLPSVRSSQHRKTAANTSTSSMYHHVFKLRGRLLSLSSRAALAASAGTYALPSHPDREAGQERWASSSSLSGRPRLGSGWLHSSQPALAMAASGSSSSSRSFSTVPLRFRGGATATATDGPLPAALEAWPWKNPQGILMSPMDKRHYRWLRLPNGLKALVISDPNATKSAAAMSVDVGAASDPDGLPGLAHFLEHMLFLGTSKYPKENAYKSYLSKHGGRSNASTSMDATTFKFEVGAEHLRGALDIFSQFFVSPLFSESSTGRELLAVDSEDSKNRTNDGRRILQVLKALADEDHPYSNFSTGNLKTLKDDVPEGVDTRRELLAFHGKHYRASNMALVVLGKEDLDHLEGWAKECFKEVQQLEGGREGGVEGRGGAADFSVTAEGESVADALAKTMNSPWSTPPALVVDMEPLRDVRQLMIQ
ncbi:unnamed protein product, partial [Laminaria digitata]